MATATAPEREFRVYARGELREEILLSFRTHLRQLTNPDTGLAFTESEIATATATLSQPWIRADALDLTLLAKQNSELFFADQVRVDRAGTNWLESYHARMWGKTRLEAVGGSGPVSQPAVTGTIFVGSTTIPDTIAYAMTAPDGKTYQCLFTTPAVAGVAALTLQGVDTGTHTNPATGTALTPAANIPPGANGNATVTTTFTGGIDRETDAEFAGRIADDIRHKPACGNSSHFRSWCRESSAAIEDAFIYPCALHAGSVVACITQKRGVATGPLARFPSVATLAVAIAYLTPPASPVLPARPYVVVVGPQLPGVFPSSDIVLELSMATGQASGWTDFTPWPESNGGTPVTITNIAGLPNNFQITIPAGTPGLPAGVTNPTLMVWDDATSRFETLVTTSTTFIGGVIYQVNLAAPPTVGLIAIGHYVSPDAGRRVVIAETIESYFDSLGPGEVVATADSRYHRAVRFPSTNEEWPTRVGDSVLTYLLDALGAALADGALTGVTVSTPTVPTDPISGPNMCTLGNAGIYPL